KVPESTPKKATGVLKETEQWSELPSELRLAVLDEIAGTDADRRRFPELSRVCKEWQVFFEGFLYNSFNLLREEEVAYFCNIMRGHRCGLVKRIHLHVELEKYLPEDYGVAEDEKTIHLNNQAFSRNLLSLFKTLSEWQGCGGLSLELSASSPSDTLHAWSNFRLKNLGRKDLDDLEDAYDG
ncbi:hypothetical protein K4K52_009915, partial [Colletotrichum sp. SAR 10_76]